MSHSFVHTSVLYCAEVSPNAFYNTRPAILSDKLFYINSSKELNKLPIYKIIPESGLNLLNFLWFAVSALRFQKISQVSLGHTL